MMPLAANVASTDSIAGSQRCHVRPSVIADVFALAANLRDADRAEVAGLGIDPRFGLRASFRDGMLRKTYIVDGEIAAMSGLCGSLLGDIGQPYLMTTPAVERVPVTFLKLAKQGLAEMLQHKMRLEGYVAANYAGACRLLEVLGFMLGKPEPIGPNKAGFRKFTLGPR